LTEGRAAVITGGASGIGLAAAKRFASLGMKICLADLSQDALDRAEAEMPGATVVTVPTDVSKMDEVLRLKERAYVAFGGVAVLMNNAGTSPGVGPWDHYERWQRVLGVNLWGVINGVHAFAQAMIDQQTTCQSSLCVRTPPRLPSSANHTQSCGNSPCAVASTPG
jgi:NAD(P)-dependent dehydrogenase (short-subunit alcohol dehydrogenase family)